MAQASRLLRVHWRALSWLFVAAPAAFAPLAVLERGGIRWATVGASVATGFWLVVLVTVVAGGANSQLMSLIGRAGLSMSYGQLYAMVGAW